MKEYKYDWGEGVSMRVGKAPLNEVDKTSEAC
jgi:hypothetical protein